MEVKDEIRTEAQPSNLGRKQADRICLKTLTLRSPFTFERSLGGDMVVFFYALKETAGAFQ